MFSGTSLGEQGRLRIRGKAPALHMAFVPSLPLIGWIAYLLLIGGHPDGPFIVLLCIFSLVGVLGFVCTLFLCYLEFHDGYLRVSIWVIFPLKLCNIPYDKVLALEVEQDTGLVVIQYENERAEKDVVAFMPRDPQMSPWFRDEIRIRQSQPRDLGDSIEEAGASTPTPLLAELPSGSSKLAFVVETPRWMVWGLLPMYFVLGVLFLLSDGVFDLRGLLFLELFFAALALLLVHSHQVDMRAGLWEDKHRISYDRIHEVKFTQTGWLTVTYEPKRKLPGTRSEKEASIRVKPHSDAARAASVIQAGLERAIAAKHQPVPPV